VDLKLSGKVAMVGGASKGLGFAVARALAADGAQVSIASRDRQAIEAAGGRIEQDTGGQVLAVAADLASAAAWQAAFELLVLGVVRQIRLVVPSMQARGGGAIVMSTSSAVKEPIANIALSNVLRASVAALAKSLALELAETHIRVNQLVPGRIGTDRVREIDEINARKAGISAEQQRQLSASTIPMGRYGEPDEFGRVAAFLLSDAAAYVTGASVQVDGGLVRGL
jgi:3-oxoacyl-[acyl-carrier protein] reductase